MTELGMNYGGWVYELWNLMTVWIMTYSNQKEDTTNITMIFGSIFVSLLFFDAFNIQADIKKNMR